MTYLSVIAAWIAWVRFVFAGLAFLCLPPTSMIVHAQAQIQVQVSKKQVAVGEPFEIRFLVKNVKSNEVRFPVLKQKEVIRQWQTDSVDNQGNGLAVGIYQLMILQPGTFRLPAQEILIPKNSISQNIKTLPVEVYIELLPVAQPDLRAEPLAAITYTTQEWLPYALAVVAMLMLVLGYGMYRKRTVFLRPQKSNPRKQALVRLEEVKNNGISPLDKQYALQLNHILKDYLTARFGVSAFHMTVAQIKEVFVQRGMDNELLSDLENILEQLQYLMFHPATDAKSRPNTLVTEMRQLIELVDKKSFLYSNT